jgi:hypothetical protein
VLPSLMQGGQRYSILRHPSNNRLFMLSVASWNARAIAVGECDCGLPSQAVAN